MKSNGPNECMRIRDDHYVMMKMRFQNILARSRIYRGEVGGNRRKEQGNAGKHETAIKF